MLGIRQRASELPRPCCVSRGQTVHSQVDWGSPQLQFPLALSSVGFLKAAGTFSSCDEKMALPGCLQAFLSGRAGFILLFSTSVSLGKVALPNPRKKTCLDYEKRGSCSTLCYHIAAQPPCRFLWSSLTQPVEKSGMCLLRNPGCTRTLSCPGTSCATYPAPLSLLLDTPLPPPPTALPSIQLSHVAPRAAGLILAYCHTDVLGMSSNLLWLLL